MLVDKSWACRHTLRQAHTDTWTHTHRCTHARAHSRTTAHAQACTHGHRCRPSHSHHHSVPFGRRARPLRRCSPAPLWLPGVAPKLCLSFCLSLGMCPRAGPSWTPAMASVPSPRVAGSEAHHGPASCSSSGWRGPMPRRGASPGPGPCEGGSAPIPSPCEEAARGCPRRGLLGVGSCRGPVCKHWPGNGGHRAGWAGREAGAEQVSWVQHTTAPPGRLPTLPGSWPFRGLSPR